MYDVIKKYNKPSPELVARFAALEESASISESMPGKTGALDPRIRPVWPEIRMCGAALTVECGTGDNIMLHRAIDMAKPGDVLVVTNRNYDEAGGMFGGMMAASAQMRGAAGLVIEGACRDTVLLKKLGFATFSRSVSIKYTTKLVPGKINHPLMIGGVVVNPGDIVYGDADGVVVVPLAIAEEVLKIAEAREKNEEAVLKRVQSGEGTVYTLGGFNKIYEGLGLKEEDE